jgi:hypothetical protein
MSPMQKQNHILTKHARMRLSERSSLPEDDFISLADACSVLVYRADSHIHYEMLWSSQDKNAYVLVVQPDTLEIITIKCVLTRSGHPCKLLDERKKPSARYDRKPGVASVTSWMLEQAIHAAGGNSEEAEEIFMALKKHEKKPERTWNYRWVIKFLYSKENGSVGLRCRTIGKEVDIPHRTPEEIICESISVVDNENGWGAVLSLIERGSENVVFEIQVDSSHAASPIA